MAQPALEPALNRIIVDLCSRDEVRKRAAAELRDLIITIHRDSSQERFNEFYNTISTTINQLVHASDSSDKLGAIYALYELIDFDGIDQGRKTARSLQSFREILREKDLLLMQAAAVGLGKLCKPGGSLVSELVESEVKTSLEWLQSNRIEERRYAAVLELRELARNAPTLMYAYVGLIFDQIWVGIRDQRLLIRQTAAEVINACFQIIRERDQSMRQMWQKKVYDEAVQGLKQGSVEYIHGSLLVFKELLQHGGMFMHEHYQEVCEVVFRRKDHKNLQIRRTVIILIIPELANYSPTDFTQGWLHEFMVYLSSILEQDKDRNDAFLAVGNIANAVKSSIAPYLEGILKYVRDALSSKSRKRGTVDPVLDCISRLAVAAGQTMSKYMDTLIDLMFACELTPKLTQAFVDIAFYVPSVKVTIQERLLDLLSKVLCGEPFKQLGEPPRNKKSPPTIVQKGLKDPLAYKHHQAEIKLALNTLGSFDFSGHVLNEFIRDVTITYIEDDDEGIREAAALTCCQLYIRDPIVNQTSYHAIKVVSEVIEKLLTLSIADPDPNIRQTVLAALDERFDRHLAKAENIRTLFLALNDEIFSIREVAIAIIGRLMNVNPAYIVPSLRKLLIQMLTELEFSEVARNVEENAKLLSLLVQNCQRLLKPYVDPMISILLPKSQSPNPAVSSTILRAIGDLATIGGEDIMPYIDKIMPIIIEALQDQSSIAKREAALQTLGQVASNSGYVIKPYLDYPELLDILRNIIGSEPHLGPLRQQTIKVMGILGALDPYKHRQVEERSSDLQSRPESTQTTDISLMVTGLMPSDKEYFPTVVINALLHILRDQSLSNHHPLVVEVIMNIFRILQLECVPFLDKVVPAFITLIGITPSKLLNSYFNQMTILVTIVRQHIRNFLPEIITVLQEYWNQSNLQLNLLALVEAISKSLEGEFRIYLAGILPLMLGVLEKDISPQRHASERVLHAFLVFGQSIEEYTHLIIPVIVNVFGNSAQPSFIKRSAIDTIGKMSQLVNLNEYASKIIHPLARVLAENDISLRMSAIDCLCALIFQLGKDYLHFAGTVQTVLTAKQISHQNYELMVSKLRKNGVLPQDLNSKDSFRHTINDHALTEIQNKKLDTNPVHLKAAWEATGKSTKEDWQEWLRKFSIMILTESPNQALRACAALASSYPPLAKELFNSAFVSCWEDLVEPYQDELIQNIELAIRSPLVTPDVLGVLLNLAEFMEHYDKPLPIDIRILSREAGRCHAWAKALHYKELEFLQDQSSSAFEAFIQIDNHLQQYDAAIGILRKAQQYKEGVQLQETWFEKLERWEEALEFYQKREQESPDEGENLDVIMGKMRCLHALGEWDSLAALAQDKWQISPLEVKRAIAPLATAAAWDLARWDQMDDYLSVMKADTPDRLFYGSILALHRNQFREVTSFVQRVREGLDSELSALVGESYSRAYAVVVRVQMLAELEELAIYKQNNNNPTKQETMRTTWERRLLGCERSVEVWQRMLKLRALVISPAENTPMLVKFSNLCRKAGRMGLAETQLKVLVGSEGSLDSLLSQIGRKDSDYGRPVIKNMPLSVQYAVLKYHWAAGKQDKALDALKSFTTELTEGQQAIQGVAQGLDVTADAESLNSTLTNMVPSNYGPSKSNMTQAPINTNLTSKNLARLTALLARCWLKQGEWQVAQRQGDWNRDHVHDILASYWAATQYNPNWYKAWHAWALANFEIVQSLYNQPKGGHSLTAPRDVLIDYVVPAIRGFVKSIALSHGSSLQDTLRLLTLWFAHGGNAEVNAAVTEGFASVNIDTWLEVIPQLIARINQPNTRLRQSVHNLLADVGRAHPQALVYPLTVAIKSAPKDRRSRFAMQLIDNMRQHSALLVEQANMISHELIRVTMLWHELWYGGLEEASVLLHAGNMEGMFDILAPLHEMLEHGPETLYEISFAQTFGHVLQEAREWCFTYRQSGDVGDINQAWDLYYQVFKKIARQLPQLNSLDLAYVSPKLLNARDLDLAVPGTYSSGRPVIRISKFATNLPVIVSKQRPRKLSLQGSDGTTFSFLLKGHDDIRQDERVMQLFGLCNTLLTNDNESYKRHLNIIRFPIIPLSQNSGLIGWVSNSDTLHALIRDYRESRKILLNIEYRLMLQMAPDYENLTLLQKVEVFGYALDNTSGQDLYRVLWLKSQSSESWLERRTNYTRSLGVMSMVGYILGLGDRHPSNIMFHHTTGKIFHVDFGDCFEIAMHRERFPEKVPFRLTRLLTYAMEVSHIEGSFKITCEIVMRILRDNKESLMAVLEAFIHDPLLNWRLLGDSSPLGPSSERRDSFTAAQSRRPSIKNAGIMPSALPARDPIAMPGAPSSSRPRVGMNSTTQAPKAVDPDAQEKQNERAKEALDRVKNKLAGRDFKLDEELTYVAQVDKLITEATKLENLCQHYVGWCSFW